jgi:endonuclease-3
MNDPNHLSSREKAIAVYEALTERYPDTRPPLVYRNAFELLVAVILSAQTTDRQVNLVTPELFATYPDARSLAGADVRDVERIVHSVGFYRTKARNIVGAAAALTERFGGEVPDRMEELVTLPGVGRKSANVVLGHCFDRPAVIVDTHFMRVTNRLGLSGGGNPDLIEAHVRSYLPPEIATGFSMAVNYHGRNCCTARAPACEICPITALCDFYARRPVAETPARSSGQRRNR